jgi:hypothetical protein
MAPRTPTPDDTRFGALANIRGTFGQEMANNPDLRRRLMAVTTNEVGTDNDAAKQALIETVFNRAASRKMTLEDTLNSVHVPGTQKGYWDPSTGAAQNKPVPQDVQDSLNPMIDKALAGSNVTRTLILSYFHHALTHSRRAATPLSSRNRISRGSIKCSSNKPG